MPTSLPRDTVYPASSPRPALVRTLLLAAIAPFSMGMAVAAPSGFSLTADSTTAQTLGSGSGQVGSIAAGVKLALGGGTNAVTITGNSATLNNLGSILQGGTGRAVRDNTGVSSLVVNNGAAGSTAALMQTADGDVIQMNVASGSVTLNNYGTMTSLNASNGGAQAVDFNAILTGSNTVNNYGTMQANEADAVRPGVNGRVYNAGAIRATNNAGSVSSSDGIDAQNNSGVIVINDPTGVLDGARHGITGGQLNAGTGFTMSVTNSGIIRGNNGSGMNLDGFNNKQVITVANSGLISGNGISGDGDGIDVDGLVNITNSGTIRSINAFSAAGSGLAYSEGISVGGGVIVNSGTIEGLVAAGNGNAVGRGITLAGNDITSGALAGTREGLYGNATITNQAGGLIRGQTDSGIVTVGAASGYTVTINNNAGATVRGGGASSAAIRTGADNTVIVNGGVIDGSSSGKAIEMGSGVNTLTIVGGNASVLGNIDGGSGGGNKMVVDAGAGNSFSYAGSISHFASVEFASGHTTLSGVNAYTGATLLSGGTLTLDGANRIDAASALTLAGGTLQLVNAGGANGQTFASLSLTDNSAIALGGSSLTFNGLQSIVSGKTLTFTEYVAATSGDYAFRVLGNYTGDAGFLALLGTIDGLAATVRFDGVYTDVTAVPEPGTYAMLLAGLGLMGALVRRRRR